MHYVVGFVFRNNFSEVALIRKLRPDYLKGFLNGPGGHVERGEKAKQAVVREIEEETGLVTYEHLWHSVATVNSHRGDRIDVFAVRYQDRMGPLETLTDEPVCWYETRIAQSSEAWHSLAYLVPLAIKVARGELPHMTIIERAP